MSDAPLVSVVLPMFNAESFIETAAHSVLNQIGVDLELLIVDDGSTDQSLQIAARVAEQDDRVTLIRLERNQGYSYAMNAGINEARGQFLARMDADDYSTPIRLKSQLSVLLSEEFAFCATTRFQLSPAGIPIKPTSRHEGHFVETWDDLIQDRRLFTDPSVVVALERVHEVGGYRTYTRAGQDIDLWFRLMNRFGPVAVLGEPLYGRRLLPSAITFTPELWQQKQLVRGVAREERSLNRSLTAGEIASVVEESRRESEVSVEQPGAHRVRAAQWLAAERSARVGDGRGALSFVKVARARDGAEPHSATADVMRAMRVGAHWIAGQVERRGSRNVSVDDPVI